MRLFIAVELSNKLKSHIKEVQGRLEKMQRANYTREENMHITLAFLGETPQDKLRDIYCAMEHTAQDFSPFSVKSGRTGMFGRRKDGILYIDIQNKNQICALADTLRKNLKNSSVYFDEKRFAPHITIARRFNGEKINLKEINLQCTSSAVDKIILMESTRINGKLKYIPRKICALL